MTLFDMATRVCICPYAAFGTSGLYIVIFVLQAEFFAKKKLQAELQTHKNYSWSELFSMVVWSNRRRFYWQGPRKTYSGWQINELEKDMVNLELFLSCHTNLHMYNTFEGHEHLQYISIRTLDMSMEHCTSQGSLVKSFC
ncbi:uncharacterized protein LOC104581509 [Brachypodium distachyon]|uniref:uncharacterized protein LOC104581509 n=1 Tax=Brachypodium distachyon TaxID=15368 RepID=UPI000D0CA8D8|nr:uncharacterized protein LOC104581509 [Brachypodium distachyon]|eukprot:XP_024317687.1 uncharacterized protein LOC104581509 [Brachypodium distachyon]